MPWNPDSYRESKQTRLTVVRWHTLGIMRNYLFVLPLFLLFSCDKKTPDNLYSCSDSTFYTLGHSIDYQNINGLTDYEEFVKSNHLDGECKDSLIYSIFKIINLINLTAQEIDIKTGGIDIDGNRMAACETKVGGEILIDIGFFESLNLLISESKKWSNQSEYHGEMVKRLQQDIRIITNENYDRNRIKNRTVIHILLDLNTVKMNLLFSETIMFQMLKSHAIC